MSVPTPPARMIVKRTSRVIWCSSTALGSKRPNWSTGTATGKAGTASAIHTASAVLDQSHSATLPTALTAVPVDVGATAQTVESAVALQAQWQDLLAELAMLAETLRGIVHAASIPAATPQDPTPPKPKRKYTPRKTDQKVDPVPLTERKWITIKQAAAIYPKSEQAWRHLVHQASQYLKYPKAGLPSNGFEKCIVRQPGSRNVYLIVEELDRWMATGQEGAQ